MPPLSRRSLLGALGVAAVTTLAACGGESTTGSPSAGASSAPAESAGFPVTIKHAFGETVIEAKPERVASVAWSNGEVPLALGVVPVGMAKAAYGDDDSDGVLPWVKQRLDELGGTMPALFDESDSIDFEGVADTRPDVILAASSGLSQADYDTLSQIAPTVAYPGIPWGTSWQDTITMNATAIGLKAEGEKLVADLTGFIDEAVAKHPDIKGTSAMMTYLNPKDLSSVGVYTTHDTRVRYLADLGLAMPEIVTQKSDGSKEFYFSQSAEQADVFDAVGVIIGYGDASLVKAVESDRLLSKIPAVERGALAMYPDATPLAAAATPSALSIRWALPQQLTLISEAAAKK